MWKACPADERDYWQGLAQLCVGVTHLQRGNREGAITLLRRGAGHLTGRLAAWGLAEADRLAAAGPDEQVPLPVLRLRDSGCSAAVARLARKPLASSRSVSSSRALTAVPVGVEHQAGLGLDRAVRGRQEGQGQLARWSPAGPGPPRRSG